MLLIGLEGPSLDDAGRALVAEPVVSGVILFTRNFRSRAQLEDLVGALRDERPDHFLIAVDQEGGPVQRFRDGYTRLPALSRIGALYDTDRAHALDLAEMHAWVMATEIRASGIDLSFAPVVDLGRGNRAIGTRAFHADPEVVSALGLAYLRGMRLAGMAATIKHFPGHGSVLEDTHFDGASDRRPLAEIDAVDLLPFRDAIAAGAEAVMMAHVSYPEVDPEPAGYSRRWISDILRGQLGFRGAVFSDDIGMAAAESAGGLAARIDAHLAAGCDFVLACAPAMAGAAVDASRGHAPAPGAVVSRLQGLVAPGWGALVANPQRNGFVRELEALET
jgi:beta-N-acetylhexosaminidase